MEPIDMIIIAVLAAILGLAGWYICRAKKSGKKCIGCPHGCSCPFRDKNSGCCGCGTTQK